MPAVYETEGITPRLVDAWTVEISHMDRRLTRCANYLPSLDVPNRFPEGYLTHRNRLAKLAGVPEKSVNDYKQATAVEVFDGGCNGVGGSEDGYDDE